MATIAIDSTEIRAEGPIGEPRLVPEPKPAPAIGRRNAVVATAGVVVVLTVIGAAGFAAYPHLPRSLSGLGFAGDAPKPKRSEIRIGKLPDMPEIRNGVPELVGTKPVRVIATDGYGVNAATAEPATAEPAAAAAKPPVPANLMASAPSPTPSIPDLLAAEAKPQAAPAPVVPATVRATLAAPAKTPAVKPEPMATASILVDTPKSVPAPAALVPLPPARVAALPKPEVFRPDKPAEAAIPTPGRPAEAAIPAKPATKTARAAKPTQTAATAPAPTPVAPAAPADEDRVDFLGMKLPNGRDFQNVVSSIGDAITSLPGKF